MDKLNKLTNTFASVWDDFQYVSFRMWKEGDDVRFLFQIYLPGTRREPEPIDPQPPARQDMLLNQPRES